MSRTVLIDGDCALCNGFARFVSRRDKLGNFSFVPGNQSNTVILIEDGQRFTRSEAILRIIGGLGFPWPVLGWLGSLVPAPLRDAVYDWVAKRRRKLSCRIS